MKQAAELVIRYFTNKQEGSRTLVESFSKIPIRFNYYNRDVERNTFKEMKTLTTCYSETGTFTPEMHVDIIKTIEKKLKPTSRIAKDYFEMKKQSPPDVTWEDAFIRFTTFVIAVRVANVNIATYGSIYEDNEYFNANTTQSQTIVEPTNKRSFAAAVYEQTPDPPGTQPQQAPTVVATRRIHSTEPIKRTPLPPCRSCGHVTHTTQLCPVLFYTDANND